jgi:hypothetical protein
LAAVIALPPLVIPELDAGDYNSRALAWAAWFAVSGSLSVVALLDWSRPAPEGDGAAIGVIRSLARAFVAAVGVVGTSIGLLAIARVASDLVAGNGSFGMAVFGTLIGISMLCTGIQIARLPYQRGTL